MGIFARYLVLFMLMHPLHLAIVHIYDDHGLLNLSVKVFKDDLENAVYHSQNKKISTDHLTNDSRSLVFEYIDMHLNVYEGGNVIELERDTIIIEADVAIIKYKGVKTDQFKFSIKCDMFYELFSDQTNLVMVKIGKFEKGFRLNTSKDKVQFNVE